LTAEAKADKALFVPLKPKRNFEEVAQQIKDLIFSGKLKPLERLPSEREMAEQFNASRNTVREAYRILEETGFIEMKTGNTGGAWVRELDGRMITQSLSDLVHVGHISLKEITQARMAIELSALREGFHFLDDADIDMLEKCLENTSKAIQEDDTSNEDIGREELYNFHVKLAGISRNRAFTYLVTSMVNITKSFIFQHVSQMTGGENHIDEHYSILHALKKRDQNASMELLRKHILHMEGEILKKIANG
jgi:DNA-binding FadR family transcriptional regulator